MGLFDILWGKHGHNDNKIIQELFAALRKSEDNEARVIKLNEHLERDRDRLEYELRKCLKDQSAEKVKLVIISSNNKNQQTMSINLTQGGPFSLDSVGLIDTDTQAPVQATFANVSFVGSDDTIFTTVQDPANPNQTQDTPVAPGQAALQATADATYTDSKTNLPVTKVGLTVTVPVIVTAVVAGENVALVINQGAPVVSFKKK